MTDLRASVEAAIKEVYDPCSLAADVPLSLVDMGLVIGIEFSDHGHVDLSLRLTSSGCTMLPVIVRAVEERLCELEGVRSVTTRLVDDVWTPSQMSDRGRTIMATRRERMLALMGQHSGAVPAPTFDPLEMAPPFGGDSNDPDGLVVGTTSESTDSGGGR